MKLSVWQRHRWLGLQMVRAAVSVPANIAEGYGRGYTREDLRFVDIARGSLSELEYYVHFVRKESLLPAEDVTNLTALRQESCRTLHGLWNSFKIKLRPEDSSDSLPRLREVAELYGVEQ